MRCEDRSCRKTVAAADNWNWFHPFSRRTHFSNLRTGNASTALHASLWKARLQPRPRQSVEGQGFNRAPRQSVEGQGFSHPPRQSAEGQGFNHAPRQSVEGQGFNHAPREPVEGHGFSRAAQRRNNVGFSP